jgi:hypothetical protein
MLWLADRERSALAGQVLDATVMTWASVVALACRPLGVAADDLRAGRAVRAAR